MKNIFISVLLLTLTACAHTKQAESFQDLKDNTEVRTAQRLMIRDFDRNRKNQ